MFKLLVILLTQAYISFCSYVAQGFENFFQTFHANEMFYMLHDLHEICKLVTNLMSKFIRRNVLSQNSQGNVGIDVLNVENHKSKKIVEIGVKARLLIGEPNLVSRENQDAFTKSVRNFIQQQQNICRDICPLMCFLFVMHSFCIWRKEIILVLLILYQIYH